MKKGKLECGYSFKVDERVANDFEILWLLRKAGDDLNCLFEALEKIFGGKDEVDKLVQCLKDKDGFVETEKFGEVIPELFKKLGDDGKNS